VGIEGTGTYGAGLSRHLAEMGVAVIEVNRPDRSGRRLRGKSDDVDAEAAARAVLSGQAKAVPKAQNGAVEAIRVLRLVYASAIKDRTAAINQFHAVVSTAPDAMRAELAGLTATSKFDRISRWRERTGDDVVAAATRRSLRELAARITMLSEQAERVDRDLTRLVEATPQRLSTSLASAYTPLLSCSSQRGTTPPGSRAKQLLRISAERRQCRPRRARPTGTA
ncbi:MAG: transposase, partial [Acidimicrobiia bacterium]